ncbi:MAG: FAD-binding protein [Acidobacteria bacterium]|nr:MAG: FAD-binding protein [Acidobacteriota bacterium]GIK78704.1 MAG: glycolate oxidase subunit GlcD [Actinomycetes bacterium]
MKPAPRHSHDSNPAAAVRDGALAAELATLVPLGEVISEGGRLRDACSDATESRGLRGATAALVLPGSAAEVAAVMAWCYERDVPIFTRGGGTGLAGGAVPDGGIVLSLEGMHAIRAVDPGQWRMEAEAGVRTARVQRVARENGLLFPPDPGAGEQSTLGGNIATNAGGPHAFKYGVTGSWVTGLEVVLPPGDVVTIGGPVRKDVAGFDLLHLMTGSEGTLGVITAAWLRLVPAPEAQTIVVGFYDDVESGCSAVADVMGSGLQPAVLEYLDAGALAASIGSFPFAAPGDPAFAVIAEVDGSAAEVEAAATEVVAAMSAAAVGDALRLSGRRDARSLWGWRDGVSIAVNAQRGGKVSEDIVVPVDRLADAIRGTLAIGERHGLPACSWGHAGDGNIHASFLIEPGNGDELARAERAAGETFDLAIELGGSISGEHGIGSLKTGWVEPALGPALVRAQGEIKRTFDPKLLLNPGKKVPIAGPRDAGATESGPGGGRAGVR